MKILRIIIASIIGLIVLFLVGLEIINRFVSNKYKMSVKELAEFHKKHQKILLSETQKRWLTFGAIYALADWDGRQALRIEPWHKISYEIKTIREFWGVDDVEGAKEVIDDLLACKTTMMLDRQIIQMPSEELKRVYEKISKGLQVDMFVVEQTKSSYAWDLCRAVNMARNFYFCDYLTESEMWVAIENAIKKAAQQGKDWTDYTVSFLLGRALHGFGIDDMVAECKQLLNGESKEIKDIDVYKRYLFK